MKPEKYTAYEFYVEPIMCGIKDIVSSAKEAVLIVFGWWSCEGCGKLHSPKVKKFREYKMTHRYKKYGETCSKGKDRL